jgi:methylated-DNA-[protein]-cysteine S-methyltransferase
VVSWSRYAAKGFGTLWLLHGVRGLVSIDFDATQAARAAGKATEIEVPDAIRVSLERYFAGEREGFVDVPLELYGTPFQLAVWEALRQIPWGEVKTYGEIAAIVGGPKAQRAVGAANARNPLPVVIPCHRVLAHGNRLGGYTGGLSRKRFLLRREGMDVVDDVVREKQLTLFGA